MSSLPETITLGSVIYYFSMKLPPPGRAGATVWVLYGIIFYSILKYYYVWYSTVCGIHEYTAFTAYSWIYSWIYSYSWIRVWGVFTKIFIFMNTGLRRIHEIFIFMNTGYKKRECTAVQNIQIYKSSCTVLVGSLWSSIYSTYSTYSIYSSAHALWLIQLW